MAVKSDERQQLNIKLRLLCDHIVQHNTQNAYRDSGKANNLACRQASSKRHRLKDMPCAQLQPDTQYAVHCQRASPFTCQNLLLFPNVSLLDGVT